MWSAHYFCPVLTKFGVCLQIFVEVTGIRFHRTTSSESRDYAYARADGQTDIRTEMAVLVALFTTYPNASGSSCEKCHLLVRLFVYLFIYLIFISYLLQMLLFAQTAYTRPLNTLPAETFEMKKSLLTLSLAKPKQNAETILRNYKLFDLIVEKYITNFF